MPVNIETLDRLDRRIVAALQADGRCSWRRMAEVLGEHDLPRLVLDELPATVGVVRFWSDPVLRYHRTVREWRPSILSEAETAALSDGVPLMPPEQDRAHLREFSSLDTKIVRALVEDGRVGYAELSRLTGVSEATARRRVDWLLSYGGVRLRVVVDPALLDLPVEAMLWIKAHSARIEQLATRLIVSPQVRYVAAIAGEYQLVADVTAPDDAALFRMVRSASWAEDASLVETDIVLAAAKRSGVQLS